MEDNYFASVARQYAQFRPGYPSELFAFLAGTCADHHIAWDCATGSGQAAHALVSHFDSVVATDVSAELLAQALPHERVTFQRANALACGLPAASVDLITVANAMHWFHGPEFEREVRRVLRPGGVIAAWCYAFADILPAVDAITWHLHDVTVGPHWIEPNRVVERGYHDLHFPFETVAAPPFTMTSQWDLDQLEGYLRTWSAVTKYLRQHGVDPVAAIHDELAKAWGDPRVARAVRWRVNLRVGRVAGRRLPGDDET